MTTSTKRVVVKSLLHELPQELDLNNCRMVDQVALSQAPAKSLRVAPLGRHTTGGVEDFGIGGLMKTQTSYPSGGCDALQA